LYKKCKKCFFFELFSADAGTALNDREAMIAALFLERV
jgi:hypothetical protein